MSGPGPAALDLLKRPTWRDVWFGAAVQWIIFVPLLVVLMMLGSITLNPGVGAGIGIASPILSAPVGALVTFGLGAPLAMALARWMTRTTSWIAHLWAFLGLGFFLAAIIVHAWMLVIGDFLDSPAWFASMYVLLPIVCAAALSVGAGWATAWHRAVVREREPATEELVLVAE